MPSPAYASKEDEFWYNVSQQDELPLAGTIDLEMDVGRILAIFRGLNGVATEEAAAEYLSSQLTQQLSLFSDLRQFLGISDKRAYLELSFISSRSPHPTENYSLCGCHPWTLARHPMNFFLRLLSGAKGRAVQHACAEMLSEYLLSRGLWEAASGFSTAEADLLQLIYTRLIIPKEYQQKAAKRRGHGCEAALANVLQECGVNIVPADKATNPMGANAPHLDLDAMAITNRIAGETHAFDLLVLNGGQIKVAIQSLIHTSDPGQYGVDKSNETVHIYQKFRQWRDGHRGNTIELWGLLDGVGFSENKPDTINKLIRNLDHFLQIRTTYKAPLRLHELGVLRVRAIHFSDFYDVEDVESIARLYVPNDVKVIDHIGEISAEWQKVQAGAADIYL
jgi:hypothetical protein